MLVAHTADVSLDHAPVAVERSHYEIHELLVR
jgi:hypothetical protein